MRYVSWRLPALTGIVAGTLLIGSFSTPLVSLPLVRQADTIEVWFAGRANFAREQSSSGPTRFRTARWEKLRPGDCTIDHSEITIRSDGGVQFEGRVRSNDDGDHYCIIVDFYDHDQFRLWRSPRMCTPFELAPNFKDWVNSDLSIPTAYYQSIAFALREDHC